MLWCEGSVKLYVDVLPASGQFQVIEGESVVISGRVSTLTVLGSSSDDVPTPILVAGSHSQLNSDDVYKEMRLRGYEYGSTFRGILSTDVAGEFYWFCVTL